MVKKRSKATIRKRTQPPGRWGVYPLTCALLLAVLVAAGAADQMLATSASPEPTAAASGAAGASSTRTLYSYGGQLRPLVEETNGVQTLNIYGPGGQIIAQVAPDGQGGQAVRHLLADHLGSTRVALDADGNVVARIEYDPHGETAAAEVRYRSPATRGNRPKGCTRRRPAATTPRWAASSAWTPPDSQPVRTATPAIVQSSK